jgi:hypothetical protein
VFGPPHAPGFDLGTAADAAVDVTLGDLLDPERLNRVAAQGGDPAQLQIGGLLGQITTTVFREFAGNHVDAAGHAAELRRRIQARTIIRLAAALQEASLDPTAKAAVKAALDALGHRLAATKTGHPADLALARYYADLILNPSRDGLAAIAAADTKRGLEPPPGMPIGAAPDQGEACWFCEAVSF